ncbi:Cytochrome [Forsythia ovata]|uniref:Cytochrome n=1 Tax=Forsythia ovata TaxID=205694 RepID=A0ABD1TP71_9LAMI
MLSASLIWYPLVVIAVFSFLHGLTKKKKKLPPGPRGVPILGHLHMLGKNPHQDLHRIAQIHGPIMYMQFGFVPNIIVSSLKQLSSFLRRVTLFLQADHPIKQLSICHGTKGTCHLGRMALISALFKNCVP